MGGCLQKCFSGQGTSEIFENCNGHFRKYLRLESGNNHYNYPLGLNLAISSFSIKPALFLVKHSCRRSRSQRCWLLATRKKQASPSCISAACTIKPPESTQILRKSPPLSRGVETNEVSAHKNAPSTLSAFRGRVGNDNENSNTPSPHSSPIFAYVRDM